MLIKIALPVPINDGCLVYLVPNGIPIPQRGARVLVPLQRREVVGLVIGPYLDEPAFEVREIKEVWDHSSFLPPVLLDCLEWASRYYMYPLGHVIDEIIPGDLLSKRTPCVSRKKNGMNVTSYALVESRVSQPLHILTNEQTTAVNAIEKAITSGVYETFLLHGVTGSGKTEVYLSACERALALSKQALILVPEIAMTPQTISRFQSRFGDVVSALHSGLTPAQRKNQWLRILNKEAKVVVGARSAVFAPVWDLGLIVVDEEHDPSYKQDDKFRYNARDIAVMRGRMSSAVVVLGSATPSLSSYRNALTDRYRLITLTRRVEERPLPVISLVDMREEMRRERERGRQIRRQHLDVTDDFKRPPWLSEQLDSAIHQTLEQREQVLLFLNRRGYASHVFCADCGHVFSCEHCSVSLSWHRKRDKRTSQTVQVKGGLKGFLLCHYCGKAMPAMPVCPKCEGTNIQTLGYGTERVVEELRSRYRGAEVAQLDRDVAAAKGYVEEVLGAFKRQELDILVGTQMVTKGHDFPHLTLVGVLFADMGLNLPEYNAAERTYQLLSQVAGRAGRGGSLGRVIVQTWLPEHYVLEYVMGHDYVGFYEREMAMRSRMKYPPVSRMINLLFNGLKEEDVQEAAYYVRVQAETLQGQKSRLYAQIELLGPAPSPISRLKNQYRWQLLIKGIKGVHAFCDDLLATLDLKRMQGVRLQVDVDPMNFI
jgi:primosomal protein N' (replication factor Y)